MSNWQKVESKEKMGLICVSLCLLFAISLQYIYSCLTHIINLATQAFLPTHSKSGEYDSRNPESNLIAEHEFLLCLILGKGQVQPLRSRVPSMRRVYTL